MGVQPNLITTASPTPESHRAHNGRRILCHEAEVRARTICNHGDFGRLISARLTDKVAKALGRKISAQNDQTAVVETGETRVGEDCLPGVVKRLTACIRLDR